MAEHPMHFPWRSGGNGRSADTPYFQATPGGPYRVLSPSLNHKKHAPKQSVRLEAMPSKPAYAYGWFGSNPSQHWGRHFEHSGDFTRWTRR